MSSIVPWSEILSCTVCRESKPYTEFYVSSRKANGRTSACADCMRDYQLTRQFAPVQQDKACTKCEQVKPWTAFSTNKIKNDGLCNVCRECNAARRERLKRYPISVTEQDCSACKAVRPASDFSPNSQSVTGLNHSCKTCARANWALSRLRDCGETRDYAELFARQQGKCGGCLRSEVRLYVDHCHETNTFRALLCHQCNGAEGFLRSAGHPLLDDFLAIMEKNLAELAGTRHG